MPTIRFLGWHKPAIELIASKLEELYQQSPSIFRRATVVVPTKESGRLLREYMAERSGGAILMPRIILTGQLLPCKGDHIITEAETLTAWVQLLSNINADTLNQYAPLIPRCPDTQVERWVVGVANKLLTLRERLEMEEITTDKVTKLLGKREEAIKSTLQHPMPKQGAEYRALSAQQKVMQNEKLRWRTLGSLFNRVDAILARSYPKKITAEHARKDLVDRPDRLEQGRLLIMACVPEFSPQIKTYLQNLHSKNGGNVEIWVHAPETEAAAFDAFGQPIDTAWTTRHISIPDAIVYMDEAKENVDNTASTIHMVNDAEDMAAAALRLAGGHHSNDIVLASGDPEFTPGIINAFAAASPAWKYNLPEGRNLMTTDIGQLPEQLAAACNARKMLPLWNEEESGINNNGVQGLDAFVALLTNTALQKALSESPEELRGLQEHVEKIRMLLLPGSEVALLDMLQNFPETPEDYKAIATARKQSKWAFSTYANAVSELITNLYRGNTQKTLEELADKLERSHQQTKQPHVRGIISHMRVCAEISSALPSGLCTIELLRHRVANTVDGLPYGDVCQSVGDIMGWRELAYTRGKQVIIAAMHDGCIPEPMPDDDFLPESLCNELGIRHEKFRIARDSYLLTSLIESRKQSGRVDFLVARQKEDGSVLAPSSLLMRCGDELPKRARTLFAESKTPKKLPSAAPCPLRRATGSSDSVTPGTLESIEQIAPGIQNPYTEQLKNKNGNTNLKRFSPSSLSTFLQCPLTFWIKNLFNIDLGDTYKENKSELESSEYGTIMHAVLDKLVATFPCEEALLQSCPAAEISDTAGIELMLEKGREIAADEWQHVYNSTTTRNMQPLAMEVQLLAIERSLQAFVIQHRQDLKEGWYNVAREYSLLPQLEYAEGEFADFYMNADRIDRNVDGRWRIIDYKTSTRDKKPHKIHFDELDKAEDSRYCRFMNVQGYEFGTVTFGDKLYRWNNVQLPLYAYGLRHPSLKDRELLGIPADADMSTVVPDLVYYNLQSKTEKLVPFYLVKDGQVEPISVHAQGAPTTEELLNSAMQTVKSAIGMIRRGLCLFSAESLELKSKPYSVLVTPGSTKPRFGALSLQTDPRSLFKLPNLTK